MWAERTGQGLASIEGVEQLLACEELERSERFRFSTHRDRYLATRAFRRRILSLYLGKPAAELAFGLGPRGKPELAAGPGQALSFNETESEGVAVLAVACGGRVGVDVERYRPVDDADGIVERFASPTEKSYFSGVPADERPCRFLRWWTGKEAYVKAIGEGLFQPFDAFSLSFEPGTETRLVDGAEAISQGWWFESFNPAPGYIGCVAVEGRRGGLQLRAAP